MLVNFFVNGRRKDEILLAFSGLFALFAGFLNGFLGAGGGAVMLFLLKLIYKDDPKASFASVTAVILPMTVISAAVYGVYHPGIFSASLYLLPAALAGGVIGALLLGKIRPRALTLIFAALSLFSGAAALLR